MKLRQGRHNKRIVYLQDLDEPTEQDKMVAVFFTAEQAELVVAVLNAARFAQPAAWWERFRDAGE